MGFLPKNKEEFEEQLREIASKLKHSSDFRKMLGETKFTPSNMAAIVDVKKYDEMTKDFEPIQYLLSFEKRNEVLFALETIDSFKKETYEQYIDEGNDYLSLDEYISEKEERINSEFLDISETVARILTGDNVSIFKEDLRYAAGWELQVPVKLIDMKSIAWENRLNGLLGGMADKKSNEILFEVIVGNPTSSHLKELREIPDGYGWPEYGLNQRVWAEVDINTPDDILLESFKKFVSDARKHPAFQNELIPCKTFSDGVVKTSHINKWRSLRLLAYFDLKILSVATGSKLTMKNYGDILFFDDYDVDTTEKVRKTLIPLANEVMSSGYLNNLLKKVLSEG